MSRTVTRLALLAALALPACTSTKMTYDNLDWVVSWQIGKFVSLREPQRELLDSGFRTLWQWHRSTQLPVYVKEIRQLADAMAQPLTRQQVADFFDRSNEHGKLAMEEALPGLANVLAALDDGQVADLLKNTKAKRDQRLRDEANLSVEEQQDKAVEKAEKYLEPWVGDLTDIQERRLHDWAQARRYEPQLYENYQQNWFTAFAALMARRKSPDFPDKLRQLFDEVDVPLAHEIQQVRSHNRANWIAMMTDLSQTLAPDQRKKAQARLRKLANDLEELAAEPAKP